MPRIGALAPLGLSLPSLLAASSAQPQPAPTSFGKAKRCLMLYMWGGPSHIDLFDMKPEAPIEIRGACNTIWMAGAGVPGGHVYGASDR